jgi:hypothetical protein
MDPVILGTLIGAGSGTLAGWALIYIYYTIGRRVAKGKERVVDRRVVRDEHLSPMFGRAISDWDRVFTVKPVHTLDAGWVFCRYVWRRRIAKHSYLPHGGDEFWFQYLVKLQYVYD